MFKLGNIKYNDVILDTCTGTAGFLATGFGFLLNKNKEIGKNIEVESSTYKYITTKQLIGVEFLPNIYTLAFSNMVLHGDGRSNLYKGDSLDNFKIDDSDEIPIYFEDIIQKLKPTFGIINPPYGDNQAIVFINRTIDLIQPNGKLIVICPSNTLSNNYKGLTDEILKKSTLEAVINLNNCFLGQNIGTHPSLFIFKKEPYNNEEIYFYDFSDDGYRYSKRGDKNLSYNEKEKLLLERFFRKEKIDGISYFRSFNNDYDNLQYIKEAKTILMEEDFINTIIDYYLYEVNIARNK